MKANIHPKYYTNAKVTCACGKSFTIGATYPKLEVDVCSFCHPFYTGQMKYVDTAGRVDAFKEKQKKAKKQVLSKTQKRELKKRKRLEREQKKPENLEEIRKQAGQKKKKASKK